MASMTLLLLLLFVGVTASTPVDLQKRIIGGRDCAPNERLYHVQLTDLGLNFRCGGSLIHKQWILTATHCLDGMNAVLGVHPGQHETDVPILVAPNFYIHADRLLHDIALVKLPRPSDFPVIELPDCKKKPTPKKGVKVQIAGHGGRNHINGIRQHDISVNLQCAYIEVVICPWLIDPMYPNPGPHEHMFCGQSRGVDVCNGDSGGGVVYDNKIYGVISRSGENACTEPAIFMDVCEYINWIQETIGNH